MYWMDMTEQEIADAVGAFGVPKFRVGQVKEWLRKGVRPKEMTNLPKDLREKLETIPFGGAVIYKKRVSPKDGTVKYLFELEDGNLVEGVLMRYSYGNTVCLSTQVGCNMGCKFCASTLEGCVRSLRPGEMLSFLAEIERDEPPADGKPRTVTNIVLMGSGEPLDNYDNVIRFLRLVSDSRGMGIGLRHISLSTCGLVPGIRALAEEDLQLTLSVSLHAPEDETRRKLMPVAAKYDIDTLMDCCSDYYRRTDRRISFEYALIRGVNDSPRQAQLLAGLMRRTHGHVNLIPLNRVEGSPLVPGDTRKFAGLLREQGVNVTVRRRLGADIDAACGQLRRKEAT